MNTFDIRKLKEVVPYFPAIRLAIVFLAGLTMGSFALKFFICCLFVLLYFCCTERVVDKCIAYWEKEQR